jgi:hypothetical protein
MVDCLPQPSKLQQEVNYFHEGFSVEVEVGVRKFETNSACRTNTTSSLQQTQTATTTTITTTGSEQQPPAHTSSCGSTVTRRGTLH